MNAWEAVVRVVHAIDKVDQQLPVPAVRNYLGTYNRRLVKEIDQIADDQPDIHNNQGTVVGRSVLKTEI